MSTDKQAAQLSPPSVSVIQASDVNGNLNISLSIPHEEQDVTATIVTKSVLENKNVDSRSSDSGNNHLVNFVLCFKTYYCFGHSKSLVRTDEMCVKLVAFPFELTGEVYPAEVPQQIITETKIEVHPNEPIKTEISSAVLDAPVAKGKDYST